MNQLPNNLLSKIRAVVPAPTIRNPQERQEGMGCSDRIFVASRSNQPARDGGCVRP
jgi:hypothetical protein